jgi:hypothetical protein
MVPKILGALYLLLTIIGAISLSCLLSFHPADTGESKVEAEPVSTEDDCARLIELRIELPPALVRVRNCYVALCSAMGLLALREVRPTFEGLAGLVTQVLRQGLPDGARVIFVA